jgi:outer membrane protein assembly factor BamA
MNVCTKKIGYVIALICIMCMLHLYSSAQKNTINTTSYTLSVHYKDTVIAAELPTIKTAFESLQLLFDYANTLPLQLSTKGYPVASIDSSWQMGDTLHINLYLGKKYNWIQLRAVGIDRSILNKIGYTEKGFTNKPLNIAEIETVKEKLLSVYENEGYPFALIYLDSINFIENNISAVLKALRIMEN